MIITDAIEQIVTTMPEIKHPSFQNATHEFMFGTMFPKLRRQVTFGTGKGVLANWGSKKYVADFFDSDTNTIFEIDGASHNSKYRKIVDALRDKFFESKGIKTIRISNRVVERLYIQQLKEDIAINGEAYQQVFDEVYGS